MIGNSSSDVTDALIVVAVEQTATTFSTPPILRPRVLTFDRIPNPGNDDFQPSTSGSHPVTGLYWIGVHPEWQVSRRFGEKFPDAEVAAFSLLKTFLSIPRSVLSLENPLSSYVASQSDIGPVPLLSGLLTVILQENFPR